MNNKEYGVCWCGRYTLRAEHGVVVAGQHHGWEECKEESKKINALSEEDIKLMGRGLSKMYNKILVTPPFVRGNIFPRLIRELENIGVDFSAVDVLQFEKIRIEE